MDEESSFKNKPPDGKLPGQRLRIVRHWLLIDRAASPDVAASSPAPGERPQGFRCQRRVNDSLKSRQEAQLPSAQAGGDSGQGKKPRRTGLEQQFSDVRERPNHQRDTLITDDRAAPPRDSDLRVGKGA